MQFPPLLRRATALGTIATLLLAACGGGSSDTTSGSTTGGTSPTCLTAHYSPGAVAVPSAADMTSYARTYSGNTGTFGMGGFTSDGGAATFVLSSNGGLSYNGTAQTVNSICKDNTLAMIYVEFGSTGAVDFMADASFTGHLPDMTGVYGAVPGTAAPAVSGITPGTGPAGTVVTISGSNLDSFTPTPLVKFGAASAAVTAASATSISVSVPAGLAAGAHAITISNGDGSGQISAGTFTVTTTATAPAISNVTPSSGPVGTAVYINGSNLNNFTPEPLVKFGTITAPVTSYSYLGGVQITVNVPAGLAAGAHAITVSNGDGSGQTSAGTFTVTTTSGGGAAGVTLPNGNIVTASLVFASNPTVAGWYIGHATTGSATITVYDYVDTLGISATDSGMSIGVAPSNGCALNPAWVNASTPACSSVGVNFNRAAGNISFSSTPMHPIIWTCPGSCTMSGTLSFTPY